MHEGSKDEDELLSRIDACLSDGRYDSDIRSRAIISLKLCEIIKESLDSLQLRALQVAHQYWHGPSARDQSRLEWVTQIAQRCAQDVHEGRDHERAGI